MKGFIVGKVIKFAVLGAAAFVAFGWVVMSLWNWLMPAIAGWHAIGFWQAVGLLVLCRLLFGGRRGFGGGWGMTGGGFGPRFARMTPEEREGMREHFRERMRGHFGGGSGGGERFAGRHDASGEGGPAG